MRQNNRIQSFINFLFFSHKYGTFTESSKTDPYNLSHDTWRRELIKIKDPQQLLWDKVKHLVSPKKGYLVADDTIIDKSRGKTIACVGFHHSGKHKRVVRGICLVSIIWTDGKRAFPIDFRIYQKSDGISKNEHLRDMLKTARQRGFLPKYMMFDSWYSSNETLCLLKRWKWSYMVGIKSNRVFECYMSGSQRVSIPLSHFILPQEGSVLSLRGIGTHRFFARFSRKSGIRYWCSNHTTMSREQWKQLKRLSFSIETMHRSLKQYCLLERCQARRTDIQTAYIVLSLCVFVKTEVQRHNKHMSTEESQRRLYRREIKRCRGESIKSNIFIQNNVVFCLQ